MSQFFLLKFVASILTLLLASTVFHAQSRYSAISEQDEADILESLLNLELKKTLGSEIGSIRTLASTNLSSGTTKQIEKRGFSLVDDLEIRQRRSTWVIDYLVVRSMELKNGLAVVMMSAVTEGRPCFGPAFRSQRSFTYAFRKDGDKWVGQLLKSSFPFPYTRKTFALP